MRGVEVFTDVFLPFRPAPVYLKVGAPLSHSSYNKTICRKLHFRAFWSILSLYINICAASTCAKPAANGRIAILIAKTPNLVVYTGWLFSQRGAHIYCENWHPDAYIHVHVNIGIKISQGVSCLMCLVESLCLKMPNGVSKCPMMCHSVS